ncbi:cation diffusion facilitator family transporter [Agromyces sp. 3263]|uniref:cation diffusion facilitator family transporter n=1 Tax=Agromyces sp. 3263 TaxID=2817750 RepID=UPI002857DC8F|nr:cation diffusion facilitator family transporter [Agromyces sp. 3263]MDR6905752.1 cation diffusion facilitator family transporter [Agromyces sp. 3263]
MTAERPEQPAERGAAPPAEEPAESLVTVVVALVVNALIAAAKSFAAVITGSASMVAEAAHSWADTGNEVLLVIAERRSQRPADARHPLGFGKDAYIWSMFAAFGLFTAGAVVSIQHGISELVDPEPASDYGVAYAVLGISFVLEGISFIRAYRQARADAHRRSVATLEHVARSSNPTLRAVFAEDAAALIGLVIAFFGVGLHQLTGSPVYDAIGSLLVGVLLGVVAVVLIARNRAFLLGEAVDDALRDAVRDEILESPEIDRVGFLHMEFIGPGTVLLVAAVDLVDDRSEADAARELRRLESELIRRPHVGRAFLTLAAPEDG